MSTIAITDLSPVGSDLFTDQESFLTALSLDEELSFSGGALYQNTVTLLSRSVVTTTGQEFLSTGPNPITVPPEKV
jgi:hypothetical protein